MQWLIDIIKELLQPMLDALKVTIHGQLGYFDRGDKAGADWREGVLTADGAWHDLDCSAIVPEGAQAIHFFVIIRDFLINKSLELRKNGNVNAHNRTSLVTQVANIGIGDDPTCQCDSDRKIEYKLSPVVWDFVSIYVKGWWLR